jgi:hypothetical protein
MSGGQFSGELLGSAQALDGDDRNAGNHQRPAVRDSRGLNQ